MIPTLRKETRLSPYSKLQNAFYTNGVWSIDCFDGVYANQEQLFIEVPDGNSLESIEIVYQINAACAAPSIHINVGKNSTLSVRERISSRSSASINSTRLVSVKEEGSFSHSLLEPFLPNIESEFHFSAFLEKEAALSCVSATALPVSKKTSVISLEGESSSADLKALSLAGKEREHENSVSIEHKGEKSSSSQLFKSVVAGSSSVESLVNVRAQKSKSQQLSRFLVVDDRAKTSNKPYLNVFADDVEATHGATTGELESEALWYLKSRGLSEKEARSLCVRGFCAEIMELFPDKNSLEKALEEMLNA